MKGQDIFLHRTSKLYRFSFQYIAEAQKKLSYPKNILDG